MSLVVRTCKVVKNGSQKTKVKVEEDNAKNMNDYEFVVPSTSSNVWNC